MRVCWTLALAIALIGAAPLAAQRSSPPASWGKAGVAFETYRTDAVECALQGHNLDIAETEAAEAFVRGSRRIDNLLNNNTDPGSAMNNAIQSARVVEAVRPEERMEEIKATLVGAVEQCLVARGYRRFALSAEQAHILSGLTSGSPERHGYLHRLASDPAVLTQQGL